MGYDIGLEPQKKFRLLKDSNGRDIPVVHLISQAVLPRPDDWPLNAHMAGYCFLDRDHGWRPQSALKDFLQAGPPPIYIGFGSIAGTNPQQLAQTVVDAVKRLKLRAILASGWGGLQPKGLLYTILPIESAPHDWLFPRVSAVVHHGGAGTTAAGLRFGKPSVIIPFFGDQPYWGNLVHKLGVGSKSIPPKKLTVDRLAKAIEVVTSNLEIKKNVEAIGEKIEQEDGIGNCVKIIENLISDEDEK